MTQAEQPDRYPILDVKGSQEAVAEWLLPHAVDDIERRLRADASRYEVIGIAPIIRRTLLDEHATLWWSIRRQKLHAPVFEYSPYLPKNPSTSPHHDAVPLRLELVLALSRGEFRTPERRAKLSTFLAAPVGEHDGEPVTVKALVDAFSHVLGGVHGGRPSNEFEQVLLTLIGSVPVADVVGLDALRDVGAVVARALRPIADELRMQPHP